MSVNSKPHPYPCWPVRFLGPMNCRACGTPPLSDSPALPQLRRPASGQPPAAQGSGGASSPGVVRVPWPGFAHGKREITVLNVSGLCRTAGGGTIYLIFGDPAIRNAGCGPRHDITRCLPKERPRVVQSCFMRLRRKGTNTPVQFILPPVCALHTYGHFAGPGQRRARYHSACSNLAVATAAGALAEATQSIRKTPDTSVRVHARARAIKTDQRQ